MYGNLLPFINDYHIKIDVLNSKKLHDTFLDNIFDFLFLFGNKTSLK